MARNAQVTRSRRVTPTNRGHTTALYISYKGSSIVRYWVACRCIILSAFATIALSRVLPEALLQIYKSPWKQTLKLAPSFKLRQLERRLPSPDLACPDLKKATLSSLRLIDLCNCSTSRTNELSPQLSASVILLDIVKRCLSFVGSRCQNTPRGLPPVPRCPLFPCGINLIALRTHRACG